MAESILQEMEDRKRDNLINNPACCLVISPLPHEGSSRDEKFIYGLSFFMILSEEL